MVGDTDSHSRPQFAPFELRQATEIRSQELISFRDLPSAPQAPHAAGGTDVLLIVSSLTKKEATSGKIKSDKLGHQPPIGLLYVAAALEAKGYSVEVIEPMVLGMRENDILDRISEARPPVVGISAMSADLHKGLALARGIRERHPQVTLIAGGVHPTLYFRGFLERHPEFDLVCVGEGEATMVEFLNLFRSMGYDRRILAEQTERLEAIKGLVYRKNGAGHFTGERSFLDLNTLPLPARHLLPLTKYTPWPIHYKRLPVVQMIVSRGCPWNCAYCCTPYTWGKHVRRPNPARVVEEVRHITSAFGAREIAFRDGTFTADPAWLAEVCERITSEGLDIEWTCLARVNDMTHPLAQAMKRAGCWQIAFGLESANQESLKAIRKGQTAEQMEEAVRVSREAGIKTRGFFMLGLPHETPAMAQQTIDLAIRCDLDYAHFFMTTPHEGTDLYAIAEQFGTFVGEPLEKFLHNHPVYLPDGYSTVAELKSVYRSAYIQFYFRPRYWRKMLFSTRSPSDLRRYYHGLKIALSFVTSSLERGRTS
jgi:radical SAM superfamily enzyme YgiQ (UPF0313 family)